jgi:hypothetical protein
MSVASQAPLALSEWATRVAEDIEELHRVQNAAQIEDYCRELAARYHKVLAEVETVLAKHGVLSFLASDEAVGLEVVLQQGLSLAQGVAEQALVERQSGLLAAANNYLRLLAAEAGRVDQGLETQRARLRSRLSVLGTLLAHIPGQDALCAQIEDLDARLAGLRLDPFGAEAWKRHAVQVYRLVEAATAGLQERFSPQTVEALSELTTGRAVPLTRLSAQSLQELLDLRPVAERLRIVMEAGPGG